MEISSYLLSCVLAYLEKNIFGGWSMFLFHPPCQQLFAMSNASWMLQIQDLISLAR